MFDELSLKAALAGLGYRPLKRHVYRAEWSTEVEHFIYLQFYGAPKEFLAADFGIRSRSAEAFANYCIETYGPEVHRLFRDRIDPDDCAMQFSLGQLAGWGIRNSLRITEWSGPTLVARIKGDIERKLFPVVRHITTLDGVLSLLLADVEPCPWIRCNCAIRAAMIAYLARRRGAPSGEIRALLTPHLKRIAPFLVDAPEQQPGAYIDRVIDESAASASERSR